MKIIELSKLREIFIELLEDSRQSLKAMHVSDIDDIKFGTDNTDYPHDKIFSEYGEYNENITTLPNTAQVLVTPGIFTVDTGEVLNNPNCECYMEKIAFEFLGFEEQREAMRKLLEAFSASLKSKEISVYYDSELDTFHYNDGNTNGVKYTLITSADFPVISDTIKQSGFNRFQAYVNIDFTALIDLELSNNIQFKVDGENISYTKLTVSRNKVKKTFNTRTVESEGYAENQTRTVSFISMLKPSSTVMKKFKADIELSSDAQLNQSYSVTYDGNTYTMFMESGSISNDVNEPAILQVSLSTLKGV